METGNAGRHPYEIGFDAHHDGKTENDNPFWDGKRTKLGNPVLGEDAVDWLAGFNSRKSRVASEIEMRAAASVDVSRFRRKSNRSYR
jgi:hypothetical protein